MKVNNEHQKKVSMAQEVGKMLPETKDKVEHYKDVLRSESNLLDGLISRQSKWWVSSIKKLRERVEAVNVTNSILNKQKIYESYLGRKKRYESWLDEMAREVNANMKDVLLEARAIEKNVRLVQSLKGYDEREDKPTINEKVEFYLYLQQEIMNHKKYGKGKRR